MAAPFNLFPNGRSSFPGTQHIIYEAEFKKRFRDKSILPLITNPNYKGRFKNKGTTIQVPILPIIETHKTRAGEGVKYQSPKGSVEEFTINRERYYGFNIEDEDKIFSTMPLESPIIAEANRQMAEDIEREFFADIIYKTHEANTGNTAGIRSGSYQLGTGAAPVALFKTDTAAASGGGTYKSVVTDYIVACINTLNEMPGGLDTKPYAVIPTAIANILQTSELKMANWMGDAQSVMRKSVRFLGELNGATIIVDDQLPMWRGQTPIYSILFGDSSAVTFADEARINDKLKDKDEWGDFHRSKIIYDWFVPFSERLGAGFVKIG